MTKKNFANRTTTAARSFVPEGGRLICICRLLHMSVVVVGCGWKLIISALISFGIKYILIKYKTEQAARSVLANRTAWRGCHPASQNPNSDDDDNVIRAPAPPPTTSIPPNQISLCGCLTVCLCHFDETHFVFVAPKLTIIQTLSDGRLLRGYYPQYPLSCHRSTDIVIYSAVVALLLLLLGGGFNGFITSHLEQTPLVRPKTTISGGASERACLAVWSG